MKLLSLILLIGVFAGPVVAQTSDDAAPVKEYSRTAAFAEANAAAADLLTALVAGELSPTDFAQALNLFADNFYVSGFITLAQSQSKLLEIDECVTLETQYRNASGDARDALRPQRNSKCGAAVNFQTLAANAPACIQANKLAAGAQCCDGLSLGVSASLEETLSGKKTNEACSAHADCRSQVCSKDDGESTGTCAPVLSCFTSAPLNAECSPENPNCRQGVCRLVDQGLEGVQCKMATVECAKSEECCSGKCVSNKCVDKYICTDCVSEGQKPASGKRCCAGLYQPTPSDACTLEMPPFILPTTLPAPNQSTTTNLWRNFLSALWPVAHAQEVTTEVAPVTTPAPVAKFKPTPVTNDTGLTRAQLDLIETAIKDCLPKPLAQRKTCLLATYNARKEYLAQNNAARSQGLPLGQTFTPEEYVKRYNIPAISPKNRSDVNNCQFNTAKDNWIDATNLQRNGELFLRAFEVSYSGKGTQDFWHLPNASGAYHKENIYTRTKNIAKELRENRNIQKDQLNYIDLMMSCQCLYTFGPDKFNADQQTFFFQFCTGAPENKVCRAGAMQNSLKLPDSPELAYREGKEFPNFVEMYLANLQSGKLQTGSTDLKNLDSSAAGINHEEVLVRWLRMRSCNQVDVFVDTEKIDTELVGLVDDLKRARKPLPALTKYWEERLAAMKEAKVDDKIIEYYKNDTEKDLLYRGYVLSETKVGQSKKTVPKFLLFIFLAVLGALALGPLALGSIVGLSAVAGAAAGAALGLTLGLGISAIGGGGASGAAVIDALVKDAQTPLVETRLVEKKSCILGLFWCKTYYRILHWPVYSNGSGITKAFPFTKKEERTCDQTASQAASLSGTSSNNCSGPFKGTTCARSFYRPIADAAIKDKTEFAPWGEIMKDKMLMDPVFPEFYSTEGMSFDYKWKEAYTDAFKRGCAYVAGLGKKAVKPEDKAKFMPTLTDYFDGGMNFLRPFQMHQDRIDAYKEAVKRYSLCKNLKDCGATLYDGKHPVPRGFLDIVEDQEQAELFANYVYQIHFKWRHMSSNTGIGYPLAYLENYYLALQYNVRLLTTLSIRRGIEFDDAYNKFAEDLAIRRQNYQDTSRTYGVTLGETERPQIQANTFFRDLRSFGIPLTSSFDGNAEASSIASRDSVSRSSNVAGGQFAGVESAANAARRFAARIKEDNLAASRFAQATKNNSGAARRTASAKSFFAGVNSPTALIPSFANPQDSTNYSGIGGELTTAKGTLVASAARGSTIGAVDTSNRASGAAGVLGAAAGFAGAGAEDSAASSAQSASDSDLDEAARVTGLNSAEVKGMLDGSAADRRKLEGSDEDSLFGRVSKAYMRNLDRVLIRRKGPEKVTEEVKPATGTEKEKEEIKRIFNQ